MGEWGEDGTHCRCSGPWPVMLLLLWHPSDLSLTVEETREKGWKEGPLNRKRGGQSPTFPHPHRQRQTNGRRVEER